MFFSDKESMHQIFFSYFYVRLTVHYVTNHTAKFHSVIKGLWQADSSYNI